MTHNHPRSAALPTSAQHELAYGSGTHQGAAPGPDTGTAAAPGNRTDYDCGELAPVVEMITPGPHDVLCGRGGGINKTAGNTAYRELVRLQKSQYNLTTDKNEKNRISQDIIDEIGQQGGRFLASKNDGFWIEVSNTKALTKTSQALREGAPSIKAQAEKKGKKRSGGSSRKRRATSSVSTRGKKASKTMAVKMEVQEKEEEKEVLVIRRANGSKGKEIIRMVRPEPTKEPKLEDSKKKKEFELPPSISKPLFPGVPLSALSMQNFAACKRIAENGNGCVDGSTMSVTPPLASCPRSCNSSTPSLLPSLEGVDPTSLSLSHTPYTCNVDLPLEPPCSQQQQRQYQQHEQKPKPPNDHELPRIYYQDQPSSMHHIAASAPSNAIKPDAAYFNGASSEIFNGEEEFSNPFECEDPCNNNHMVPDHVEEVKLEWEKETHVPDVYAPSVNSLNQVLRYRSSDTNSSSNGYENTSAIQNSASTANQGLRRMGPESGDSNISVASDDSNVQDLSANLCDYQEEEYQQRLDAVFDVAFPGLTTPQGGDPIPTRLIPYAMLRSSSFKSRTQKQ